MPHGQPDVPGNVSLAKESTACRRRFVLARASRRLRTAWSSSPIRRMGRQGLGYAAMTLHAPDACAQAGIQGYWASERNIAMSQFGPKVSSSLDMCRVCHVVWRVCPPPVAVAGTLDFRLAGECAEAHPKYLRCWNASATPLDTFDALLPGVAWNAGRLERDPSAFGQLPPSNESSGCGRTMQGNGRRCVSGSPVMLRVRSRPPRSPLL